MKNKNGLLCCLLISAFALAVASCNGNKKKSEDEEIKLPEAAEDLSILDGVGFDYVAWRGGNCNQVGNSGRTTSSRRRS